MTVRRTMLAVVAALIAFAAIGAVGDATSRPPRTAVSATSATLPAIMVSLTASRSDAKRLSGMTFQSHTALYVFVPALAGTEHVSFYIDDAARADAPWRTATAAPFDLQGSTSSGLAIPLDAGALSDSRHTVTAVLQTGATSSRILTGTFSVSNRTGPSFPTLAFDDEFSAHTIDLHAWTLYDSIGNAGFGLRRPTAVSEHGGDLVVTASMRSRRVVSGGLSTLKSFGYGYYEFRVRTDPDLRRVMSGVVLLWPQNENPTFGEEDFYETLWNRSRYPFYSFVHHLGRHGKTQQDYYVQNANAAQWHTIAVTWYPREIDLYRDGRLAWTDRNPAAMPRTRRTIRIQLDASASRSLAGNVHMDVDYVRVYQSAGSAPYSPAPSGGASTG